MRPILFYFLCIAFLLSGCKGKEDDPEPSTPKGKYEKGVWILNEGNFQSANASLTFFDLSSNEVSDSVFQKVNGRPLGDVLLSMNQWNDKYYFVVNNSQKIEITNTSDLKSTGIIEGFNSPRYMLPLGNNKAYVSDLSENAIWIVNLAQNKITGKIAYHANAANAFEGWTEQMALIGNKALILAVKTGQLLVVDTESDKIIDSVSVGTEPQWLAKDKNDKLWVLTNGSLQSKPSNLFQVDPSSLQILNAITFSSTTEGPSSLQVDGDWVYYLNNGIYRLDIASPEQPSAPFIAETGSTKFHAIGIYDGLLFTSDALNYIKPGKVYYYNLGNIANAAGSFEAGLIPGGFEGVE